MDEEPSSIRSIRPLAEIICSENPEPSALAYALDSLRRKFVQLDEKNRSSEIALVESHFNLMLRISRMEGFLAFRTLMSFGRNTDMALILFHPPFLVVPKIQRYLTNTHCSDVNQIKSCLIYLGYIAEIHQTQDVKTELISSQYNIIDSLTPLICQIGASYSEPIRMEAIHVISCLAKYASPHIHKHILDSGIVQHCLNHYDADDSVVRLLCQNLCFSDSDEVLRRLIEMKILSHCISYLTFKRKDDAASIISLVILSNGDGDDVDNKSNAVLNRECLAEMNRLAVEILSNQDSAAAALRPININADKSASAPLMPRDCLYILFPLDILTSYKREHQLSGFASSPRLVTALLHALQLPAMRAERANKLRLIRIIHRLTPYIAVQPLHDEKGDEAALLHRISQTYASFYMYQLHTLRTLPRSINSLVGMFLFLLPL